MGTYDAQQVCLNGHQGTTSYYGHPEFHKDFCSVCGAKMAHKCSKCGTDIKGDYRAEGVISLRRTPIPMFCEKCGDKYPWADKLSSGSDSVEKLDPLVAVERICNRITLVIHQLRMRHDNRETLDVADEYDLQDLLLSLLHLFFDDVRLEEYVPSYAGKAARMDFLLKAESIVVEAKMTRKGLGAKEVGEQLIIDIARYRTHPNCKTLYCLVYDPEHRIANPRGIESDLSRKTEGMDVRVFIVPRGA